REEPQDRREEGPAESDRQDRSLRDVAPEHARRRPVEAVTLLDPERRPPPEGQGEERLPECQAADEEDPGRDRATPECARRLVERAEPACEPDGEQRRQLDTRLEHREPRPLTRVLASAA